MRDRFADTAVVPAYTDTLHRLAWVRRTLQIALDVSTVSADLLAAGLLTSIHFCSLFLSNANICPCFASTEKVNKTLMTR